MIIDRIHLSEFIRQRDDLASVVEALSSRDAWNDLRPRAKKAEEFLKGSRVLEKGLELLLPSFRDDSFAMMIHAVLRAIRMLTSAIGSDDESIIEGALCWIILHSNAELFLNWVVYVNHFVPNTEKFMCDLFGGEDVAGWRFFRRIFARLLPPELRAIETVG